MPEPQSDTASLRSFISIHLPPALLAAIERLQGKLPFGGSIRWARPGQIHLTLKFLGDIPTASAADIEAAMRRACAGTKPFTLTLLGFGCFPSAKRPSVVWVGTAGDLSTLNALQTAIERETQPLARHSEYRAFRPHLTIGRVKKLPFRELPALGAQIEATQVGVLGEWSVEDVHLMKSELSPEGARHTALASVRLE
jgi:2'-5' RNA ligase